MRFNDHVNPKVEVGVELTTVDDRRFRGKLYLAGHQRVSDLMNLHNPFVPFVTSDGNLLILNKSIIACIQILETEVAMRHRQAISTEPLRHAEIRCNAASPDRNEHQ